MSQTQKLELRQGQSLVMTAQLQQSIKLLQLSSLELAEYLEQELEKNPLLAVEEGEADTPDTRESETAGDEAETASAKESESEDSGSEGEAYQQENNTEGWEESGSASDEFYGGYEERTYKTAGEYSEDSDRLDQFSSEEKTLRDHLLDQLQLDVEDPVKRMIGLHLIDTVGDNGYITEELKTIADRLHCEVSLVEETLALLQRFDPPGICARTLAECLAIQLKEKDRFDPAMQVLIANLDRLGKGDFEGLRKLCGVDAEDLSQMVAEIKALNPKPGASFSHEDMQSVEPDIYLRKLPSGTWQVELNSSNLPRVLVNQRYFAQLTGKTRDKQEKKYLSDQLATANWLVKALEQRAQTILKVATEIVAQQQEFLTHGIRYLKPLTLKDIALVIGMHESTVSRVTSNKYMATATGMYELKYFFTSSLQRASGGEDVSSKTVQHMIKELVDAESPKAILSDDAIAALLKQKGIEVARRTVTKYREAMHIPSSVDRRRQKVMFS